jgi:predicted transcriptional regulator YdeE
MRQRNAFLIAALIVSAAALAAQMTERKIVTRDETWIVGIASRTTGEKEMSSDGVIPKMWQRFYEEGVLHRLTNRADQNVYALYTDFSGTRMGEYKVVIGAKVKDKAQIPEGLVLKTIPAGKYFVLTSEKGPAPTVIPAAWIKVGALEDKDQLGGRRSYKADFEVYGPTATDPQNLQADLYVGLK